MRRQEELEVRHLKEESVWLLRGKRKSGGL